MLPRRYVSGVMFTLWLATPSAQTTTDPAGHWEGSVRVPAGDLAIVVDLTSDSPLGGSISMPSQQLTDIPLQAVTVQGQSVAFHARRDQTFSGVVSPDGQSIAGAFRMESYDFPFTLRRLGPGKTSAVLVSAPVTDALAGQWSATAASAGLSERVTLTVTNQQTGTARALLVNETEGGLQIPLVVVQRGQDVTLEAPGVMSRFDGTLNLQGTTLSGTWTQGATHLALTFSRRQPEVR